MKFHELPSTMRVESVMVGSPQSITSAILGVLDGNPNPFTFWCPVIGHTSSVRYFAQEQAHLDMIPIQNPRADAIGREMHRLGNEDARFPPRTREGSLKGWELRRGLHNGKLVMVAIATWV